MADFLILGKVKLNKRKPFETIEVLTFTGRLGNNQLLALKAYELEGKEDK